MLPGNFYTCRMDTGGIRRLASTLGHGIPAIGEIAVSNGFMPAHNKIFDFYPGQL
jgi:tetrahydromethanopterin S-methyltransferase subunit C